MKKTKIWGVIFIVLAFLTIWAVITQSRNFSPEQFKDTLLASSAGWMLAAVIAMFGYILFEGAAIICIIKAFGYKKNLRKGFLYSSADIYFSAITPSASGGQPASAYFMVKDNIPGAVVTISLLINLIMYTLALLVTGTAGFLIKPDIFMGFSLPGKILITAGYIILCTLTAIFYMLIDKPRILEKICKFFLKVGVILHLIKNIEKKKKKLYKIMEEYRLCADVIYQNKSMFVKAFFLNLLQRLSQISVTLFVYMATGGGKVPASDIWFTQSFVTIGTYSIPIPGGMGVADYLLIDGFGAFFDKSTAVNLELISRGLSFYVCMIISALTVFAALIFTIRKRESK